jgi:hypothetical protein
MGLSNQRRQPELDYQDSERVCKGADRTRPLIAWAQPPCGLVAGAVGRSESDSDSESALGRFFFSWNLN